MKINALVIESTGNEARRNNTAKKRHRAAFTEGASDLRWVLREQRCQSKRPWLRMANMQPDFWEYSIISKHLVHLLLQASSS